MIVSSDESSCDDGTVKENAMDTRSVKLMLLGIGVLLFAIALPAWINPDYILQSVRLTFFQPVLPVLLGAIVPIIGLALLLVGFFQRSQP